MMKSTWMIAASALALTACGGGDKAETPAPNVATTTEAPTPDDLTIAADPQLAPPVVAYYDEAVMDITEGWPGEYPAGFSVLEDGIVLKGRAEMTPYSPQDIDCPAPKYATYQQWNGQRNIADDLKWISVTPTFDFTILKDVTLDAQAEAEDSEVQLELKAGETVTYLRYYGEGFMAIRHDGKDYGVDGWPLQENSDMMAKNEASGEVDQWVQMPCADGKRGWVLYREALETDGVVITPIIGYGESADLSEDTAKQAREQAAAQEEWERMEAEDTAETSD